jgi:hypothetical protein
MTNGWRWRVRGYRPLNQGGGVEFETKHHTEASKNIEVEAATARVRRGELSSVEVVDTERPFDPPKAQR